MKGGVEKKQKNESSKFDGTTTKKKPADKQTKKITQVFKFGWKAYVEEHINMNIRSEKKETVQKNIFSTEYG